MHVSGKSEEGDAVCDLEVSADSDLLGEIEMRAPIQAFQDESIAPRQRLRIIAALRRSRRQQAEAHSDFASFQKVERCPSGLRNTPGKRVDG